MFLLACTHSTTTQNVGPRKYSPFDQAEAAGTMQYTFGAMHIGKNFRICLCWKSMSLLGCPDRFTDSNLRRVSPLGAQLRDGGEARYVHFSVATSTWNRAYFPLLFPRRTLLHWPLNYEFWCKILWRRLYAWFSWPWKPLLPAAWQRGNVHVISSTFKCCGTVCHEMLLFTKSVTPALDTDDWVHG